jgi:hypothetical protein
VLGRKGSSNWSVATDSRDGLNCYSVVKGYNCHSYNKIAVTSNSYKITFRDHRLIGDLCKGSQLKPVAVTHCIAVDFKITARCRSF